MGQVRSWCFYSSSCFELSRLLGLWELLGVVF